MIVSRVSQVSSFPGESIEDISMIPSLYIMRHPSIEFLCPWIYRVPRPVEYTEIVYDIPTSDDQYSLFSEKREFFPELIVPRESLRIIQTHSDHRNICIWKEMDECRPDTMIESSPMIRAKYILTSLLVFC